MTVEASVLRKLIARADIKADGLTLREKIALGEAAVMILLTVDPKAASVQAHLVSLYREEERHQLEMEELLRS